MDDFQDTDSFDDDVTDSAGGVRTRACRKCAAVSETNSAVCPECGARFERRGLRDLAPASTLVVVLIALPLIAIAFFVGQSTRKSDEQVGAEKVAALTAQKKVMTERANKKARNLLTRQEKKLRKVFSKRAKSRAEKAYERGSSAGYTSGSAAGYESGRTDGETEGFGQGLDFGACLADDYWC